MHGAGHVSGRGQQHLLLLRVSAGVRGSWFMSPVARTAQGPLLRQLQTWNRPDETCLLLTVELSSIGLVPQLMQQVLGQ